MENTNEQEPRNRNTEQNTSKTEPGGFDNLKRSSESHEFQDSQEEHSEEYTQEELDQIIIEENEEKRGAFKKSTGFNPSPLYIEAHSKFDHAETRPQLSEHYHYRDEEYEENGFI